MKNSFSNKLHHLCFITLALIIFCAFNGCKKDLNSTSEEAEIFFSRYVSEKEERIKTSNFDNYSTKDDVIDTLIIALKKEDKTLHFSEKIIKKYGLPKWNYYLELKNANGKKTIVVPVYKKDNRKIDLLIFFYQYTNNGYKVKFVPKKIVQKNLKEHGDQSGKEFTGKTLAGIFEVLENSIKNNNLEDNKTEIIKNNTDGVYLHYSCWFYSWSNGMNYYTTNTQCAVRVVLTPNTYDGISGGSTEGLQDINLLGGGSGSGTQPPPPTTEEEELELLYNCSCECPEDDVLLSYLSAIEPKWGQLGNKASLNLEFAKAGVGYSAASGSSNLENNLALLKNHFEGNRMFTTDSYGSIVDMAGSKKIDRYFYTYMNGWIDMHHFFYTAYLAEKYSVTYAINFTTAAEVLQKLAPGNYSGYSYEDQSSNIAGADFYLEYRDKIKSGELSLNAALNLFMDKMFITEPKNAPNYNVIPHIIDNFVPSSYGTRGLRGVELFNAAWDAFCKKSAAVKEKIKKAHATIKPSANN